MAFLAPALPAIIGAAGGAIGKLFGAGGPSGAQKDATSNLSTLATASGNKGLSFLDNAQTSLAGPQNYFQSILNGNQGEATTALAPDISRIKSADQQNINATTALAPRGGARSSTLFQLPSATNSKVQGLFNGVRSTSADSLAKIGGIQGSLGTSATGAGIAGDNATLSQFAQQQQTQNQAGQQIGGGLFNIAKGIDWSKLFGGGSGGGYDPAGVSGVS